MKKILLILMMGVMLSCMNAYADRYYYYESEMPAQASKQKFLLDGKPIEWSAYLIGGKNYIRLRDVANILKNTEAKINVKYDKKDKSLAVTTKEQSDAATRDVATFAPKAKATISYPKIKIDGTSRNIQAGMINGSYYFQLEDLSEYLDFSVAYNNNTKSVEIYTTLRERLKGKVEEKYLTERFYSLVEQGLTVKEAELAERINEYRREIGKPEFSISKSLTIVARTHVQDSNLYSPEDQKDERGKDGNLHSWSNNGNWKSVVYTPDHYHKELMWSKPKELTNYSGNGYEISAMGYGTPERFLGGWKSSEGHNNVIIGAGYWDKLECMGVAIDGNYSHVWFGKEEDPAGYYYKYRP